MEDTRLIERLRRHSRAALEDAIRRYTSYVSVTVWRTLSAGGSACALRAGGLRMIRHSGCGPCHLCRLRGRGRPGRSRGFAATAACHQNSGKNGSG